MRIDLLSSLFPFRERPKIQFHSPFLSKNPKNQFLKQKIRVFRGAQVQILILQAFNGHYEAEEKIVDNSVQTLGVIYNPKLSGVFGDYKKPQYTQKYYS